MFKKTFILFAMMTLYFCTQPESRISINETYQTERDTLNNVDSPASWITENEQWLIATAKSSDLLLVHNANSGELIKKFGYDGTEKGELDRPNGISVIDSLLFIVERNNQRVQVFQLPGFEHLAFVGNDTLIKPYGIYVTKVSDKSYELFVTDNYESADEQVPPPSELNNRVHKYSLKFDSTWNSELIKTFGDTSGEGILNVVESVFGDPENKLLLLSEEDTEKSSVKVYNFEGEFLNTVFGNKYFKGQVEGISLYDCENGKGFWIITDQSYDENVFHFFERKTFSHMKSFVGPKTLNTDGIWLEKSPTKEFPEGIFFAVHDDGNVSAFDFGEIKLRLNLNCE